CEAGAPAFAAAPAPFGAAPAATAIAPAGAGGNEGVVHRYYAFDAAQNGGTLRLIVLDYSGGSLEETSPGQTAWLQDRLDDARSRGLPVLVVAAQPFPARPHAHPTP